MLKVVTMYNFTKFAHWPAARDIQHSESIVIGVVGESPFGSAIKELQEQLRQKNKKSITFVNHGPYQEGMDLRGSHILFISATERRNMDTIIASLKGAPVMTISDTRGFLEAGGMISLVMAKKRIRWEINRSAIESAGLRVSSKLLQLAIRVKNSSGKVELLPFEREKNFLERFSRELFACLPATRLRQLQPSSSTLENRAHRESIQNLA